MALWARGLMALWAYGPWVRKRFPVGGEVGEGFGGLYVAWGMGPGKSHVFPWYAKLTEGALVATG